MLHLVGHCQIIDALLNTAKSRFGWHPVPEHTHFPELIDVVSAEFYYIGASYIPAGTTGYHQDDNVIESMADVSFV